MTNLKLNDEPDLSEIVEKLLNNSNVKVKIVAVRFVEKNILQSPSLHTSSMLTLFLECLKSEETSIGVPSIQILSDLLITKNFLDDPSVKQQILAVLDSANETVSLRIYNFAVEIVKKHPSMLDKVEFILERCLGDLDEHDILVMLNALEILKDICLKNEGVVYLENKGIFAKLMRKIETVDEDPMAGILTPGLMKFFGSVAIVYPDRIFKSYPSLINKLFECILANDLSLLYTALDTFGHLAKFDDGKKALDSIERGQTLHVITHIAQSIPTYPSDIKIRALNCFENIFWIDTNAPANNQINYICSKWFTAIFSNELSTILTMCKNPFEDISTSAFRLLKSISSHDFGQRGVANTGGFAEFLLDRNSKMPHELKQIKYEIVKQLSESNAFDASTTVRMQKYVREGFNYVQGVTEIAFEST
jgi:26S proteasome non-ATPase regulatory subunit 5